MCCTEPWLTCDILDTNLDIMGFTMVRLDRDAKSWGKIKEVGLS